MSAQGSDKNNLHSDRFSIFFSVPHVAPGVHSQEMPGTEVPLGWVAIFELRYRDGSRFLPFGIRMGRNFCHRYRFSNSGIKLGIDFQTLVPSWYIDGFNFCFEARYKSNQDFGAPVALPYSNVLGVNPPPPPPPACSLLMAITKFHVFSIIPFFLIL